MKCPGFDVTIKSHLPLLQIAALTSSFDRLMIAPLLLPIAGELDLSVVEVSAAATVHLVSYGVMQLVWALLSDRLGRVRVMRLSLAMAALAEAASAVSGNLVVLLVARALAGAAFAAAVPGALIYIGDTVPVEKRQGPLADLMRGTAVGAAAATVGAGAIAQLLSWRAAFAMVGALALALALLMARLPEPAGRTPTRVTTSLSIVLHRPWALLVIALAAGEGFVLLAVLNFLPAAVASESGIGTAAAGAVVAAYGVSVLFATPLVKRMSIRSPRSRLIAIGGALCTASLILFLAHQTTPFVLAGCLLLGGGWAFMHSSLQTWITDVVPQARAAAVSLFAAGLFVGSAAGTLLGGHLVASGGYSLLFTVLFCAGIPLVTVAWAAQWRYESQAREIPRPERQPGDHVR